MPMMFSEEMTHEEMVRRTVKRLLTDSAFSFRVNAAMILCAPDPAQVLETLRPQITRPDIDGGRIPPMYLKLAKLRKVKADAVEQLLADAVFPYKMDDLPSPDRPPVRPPSLH
jgi:hypothetical protein